MDRLLNVPEAGDEVGICCECGGHEFIRDGCDFNDAFYCNECASKEPVEARRTIDQALKKRIQ